MEVTKILEFVKSKEFFKEKYCAAERNILIKKTATTKLITKGIEAS